MPHFQSCWDGLLAPLPYWPLLFVTFVNKPCFMNLRTCHSTHETWFTLIHGWSPIQYFQDTNWAIHTRKQLDLAVLYMDGLNGDRNKANILQHVFLAHTFSFFNMLFVHTYEANWMICNAGTCYTTLQNVLPWKWKVTMPQCFQKLITWQCIAASPELPCPNRDQVSTTYPQLTSAP